MNSVTWFFPTYIACLIVLLIDVHIDKKRNYYVPIKSFVSAMFVFGCIYFMYFAEKMEYAHYFMLAAVVLCMTGDVLLGFYQKKWKKRFLLSGMISFGLAHMLFLTYLYMGDSKFSIAQIIVPVVLFGVTIGLIKGCNLKTGRMLIPTLIYSVLVTSFMTKSIMMLVMNNPLTKANLIMALGGILFFVSDFILLFLYFGHIRNRKFKGACHILNLASYYLAVLLIISTTLL